MIAMAILAWLATEAYKWHVSNNIPEKIANDSAYHLNEIQMASTRYFIQSREWPSSLDELLSSGAYVGPSANPVDYEYVLSAEGAMLLLQTQYDTERMAGLVQSKVIGSQRDLNQITIAMHAPAEATIQNYFLARREVPGCPDCNTLQTDLDFNGYSLRGVSEMTADRLTVDEAEIDNAFIETLATRSVLMGNNSIQSSGNTLTFNAAVTRFTGNITGQVGEFSNLNVTGDFTGRQFSGTDFITSQTSTNTNRQLLDDLLAQWQQCINEGGCQ